jgi:pimeloyl-[acyl-carrier protein] synthase
MNQISDETIEQQLGSPAFFTDPYPMYRKMREKTPVYWSETWNAWVLTGFEENAQALRSPLLFSSRGRVTYLLNQLPPGEREQYELVESHYTVGLTHADPPDHTRLRGLLTKSFAPQEMAARLTRIQAVVDELLDRVTGRGEMDIINDFAYPLPAIIVAEMLGAPVEDIERLRNWAIGVNRLFEAGGRTSSAAVANAQQSLLELRDYINWLADQRQDESRDDVISRLVAAEREGELSRTELVATAVTLFVAGHETTTYLIGNGMLAFLKHPSQMELLRSRPELADQAMEEILRFDTSVQRVWRRAVQDIQFGQKLIHNGDLVLCMLGAANRDRKKIRDPDQFDILRSGERNLGFGLGIHFCLGAPLAHLEVPAAVTSLLQRFPHLELACDELHWRKDVSLRGLVALPVSF